MRCRWTLYDQSVSRYARLKFYKKLSSSNQREVYLKFCNLDSIYATKSTSRLNKSFFKDLLFDPSMVSVRATVPEIYLVEICLKNFKLPIRYVIQSEVSPKSCNSDSIYKIFLKYNLIITAYNYLRGSLLPMPWQRFLKKIYHVKMYLIIP